MNGRPLPAGARWAIYILIAIAFAIGCVVLSQWQFDRNNARADQLELVDVNYDAPPIALDDAVTGTDTFDASLEWHPVTVAGEYLSDAQLVVRNRPHGGTSAFEVLVPFRANDGRILIVNRGWVRPAETGVGPSSIPAAPEGSVTITVRMRDGEPLPTSGRSAPEGQVPTINLPLIATETGPDTITAAYGVMMDEDPAPASTPFALPSPSADPGPHLSYAIQWILFAIMGFIFIGYIIRVERRHRNEDDEDEDAEVRVMVATEKQRARAKRRDPDADVEDAVLDSVDYRESEPIGRP